MSECDAAAVAKVGQGGAVGPDQLVCALSEAGLKLEQQLAAAAAATKAKEDGGAVPAAALSEEGGLVLNRLMAQLKRAKVKSGGRGTGAVSSRAPSAATAAAAARGSSVSSDSYSESPPPSLLRAPAVPESADDVACDEFDSVAGPGPGLEPLRDCTIAQCYLEQRRLLHPSHSLCTATGSMLLQDCIARSAFEEAEHYCSAVLDTYRAVLPPNSPLTGLQACMLGKLRHFLARPASEVVPCVGQGVRILEITHGSGHRLIKEMEGIMFDSQAHEAKS